MGKVTQKTCGVPMWWGLGRVGGVAKETQDLGK